VILSRNFLKQGPKLRAEDPLILPILQAETKTAAYSLQQTKDATQVHEMLLRVNRENYSKFFDTSKYGKVFIYHLVSLSS